MSEITDILTFLTLFVRLTWRGLEILYGLGLAFVDLFLDFTFLRFRFPLIFRDDEHGKKAEHEQDDGQCPCCFFKKISRLPDSHKLVRR